MMHSGMRRFLSHTRAVCTIIGRQRFRRRAVLVQLLRACTPCAFLCLLWWGRKSIKNDKMVKSQERLVPDMVDTFMDFSLTFTTLATVMMGMSFFVSRLATERETGLRHLLHISGLCRYSFWSATVCLEGMLQGFAEVLVILVVGGVVLKIRMINACSTVLLLLAVSLVIGSAVLLGCMIATVFKGQRASGIIGTISAIVLTFSGSIHCVATPLVSADGLAVPVLFCPVLTSFHTLWTLASSCSTKGGSNCLQLGDLTDQGPLFTPLEMAFGTGRSEEAEVGGGLLSLIIFVLCQHVVLWSLVLLADVFFFRPLQRQHGEIQAMLEIRHLVHWYSWLGPLIPESASVRTVDGVNFKIEARAMLGLLGPNGAGKTTIVRCITGEERPRSGSVLLGSASGLQGVGDADFTDTSDESYGLLGPHLSTDAHVYLGLCPQESALHEEVTVEDHLWFFTMIRRCPDVDDVVEQALGAINLVSKRCTVPSELSGGMRRRLAVGCSLVGYPSLALLDEPTTGLDPVARREIWASTLTARDAGTSCLLTTHMLEEAEELCTHIVILNRGRVAAEGSVQQLKEVWSTGYMLHLDAKVGEQEAANAYVASLLPSGSREPVKTSSHGQMIFCVGRDAEFVGNLFLELARHSTNHGIRRWGITQASLEDAYLRILSG
eukprot:TRINITY_DN6136_c0_g6_i1.p1 TRINITY_DN6136_c0_g6~~TRINITY_DN6136_c0_g6_i1.p1  ORF type:complete len:664 (+),score=70.87 TRINITY_DN6136_c0_g6_i1:53-2044(+)